jgi:hypothetical protein
MTEGIWIAIVAGGCTAIPTTLAIFVTARTQRKKLDEVKGVAMDSAAVATRRTEEAAKAAIDVAAKTETIHMLVNSKLSDEIRAKENALRQNAELMAVLKQAGIKLDQRNASNDDAAGGTPGT